MTPGALRDWIPAALHADLDAIWPVALRLLAASPSAYIGVWPSHLLACVEEHPAAVWLGAALFLGSDPIGQSTMFDRVRLWDEERDWNRHAVLLADLANRFGEALVAPLQALPSPLRPRIVTDWLGEAAGAPDAQKPTIDRRIPEAEAAIRAGRFDLALSAALRLWREGGDPLVADVIDVLDPLVGAPMSVTDGERLLCLPSSARDDLDLGRALRSGFLAVAPEVGGLLDLLSRMPPDPRVAAAIRALLLTRETRSSATVTAGHALARVMDVRGLAPIAWTHQLPSTTAAGMWTVPVGPAGRARLRQMARSAGGDVGRPTPTLQALRLRAWAAGVEDRPLAEAVYGDALREAGDAQALACTGHVVSARDLSRLPARTIERCCARPYGLKTTQAAWRNGLAVQGELTDAELAVLDPAWGAVERVALDDLRPELLAHLPNVRGVLVRVPREATAEACRQFMAEALRMRPGIVEFGDEQGAFASVRGDHTAVVTRRVARGERFLGAHARHLALRGPLDLVLALRDAPGLRVVSVVEAGVPVWSPLGWHVELHLATRALHARWYGPAPMTPGLGLLLSNVQPGTFRAVAIDPLPGPTGPELRRQLAAHKATFLGPE